MEDQSQAAAPDFVTRFLAPDHADEYAVDPDGSTLRKRAPESALSDYGAEQEREWAEIQSELMEGILQRTDAMLDLAVVRATCEGYDAFFRRRGPLAGNVLDVGGGWGLFRQWWTARPGEHFVVHDPGIERHDAGAYPEQREVYARAFSKPLVFVEGVGERLPYRDGSFDTAMINAALDHTLDPQRVFEEIFRVLVPGGTFLCMEHIEDAKKVNPEHYRLSNRVARVARDPKRVMGFVRAKLHGDHHMHHFTSQSLPRLARDAGFMQVSTEVVNPEHSSIAVESKKPFDA